MMKSQIKQQLPASPSLHVAPKIDNHHHHHQRSSSSSFLSLFLYLQDAMRRTLPTTFLFAFAALLVFAFFVSLHLSRNAISRTDLIHHYPTAAPTTTAAAATAAAPTITAAVVNNHNSNLNLIHDDSDRQLQTSRHVSSLQDSEISAVAILFPAWDVLLVAAPQTPLSDPNSRSADADYVCIFQNNATSSARFSGTLPFTNRTALACPMPNSVRRLRPFLQPVLRKKSDHNEPPGPTPELLRWTFMAYESFSTEHDVVLFVKGVNQRQGVNRHHSEFRCLFGDASKNDTVRTAVTSSIQEVFRCKHPNPTELRFGNDNDDKDQQQQRIVKVSLEIVDGGEVVPSVAYYTPPPSPATSSYTHELCACTMVYNVAKFLREWVMYHAKIGVDKFILYDNESDDDLERVVRELNEEGYNVTTLFWIWPKTQEAGFSHSAIYAKPWCKWIIYIDVDEFVFAPHSWPLSDQPSNHMLKSLLPQKPSKKSIGQVSIRCNDFGPSSQLSHPPEGVTQGYTCRRRIEQRHKSMVLLDAVDPSLLNVIHHFQVKRGFRSKQLSMEEAVVNHYKYQAWPEFQTKFRRRVSAYVVDWTQALNPLSKDRTPGLGFQPVEPKGWADMFCEVRDERLKLLTQRWFGSQTPDGGYRMTWQ